MNKRLPFETVSAGAEKILWEALLNNDDIIEAYEKYLAFIEACGWKNQEFDEETLKRVDANWDDISQSN